MNNGGYGIIKQFQNSYLGGRQTAANLSDIYGTSRLKFWRIAEAYGLCGCLAKTENDLKILSNPGFHLLDFHIDENEEIIPKLVFGNSLENMFPFLSDVKDKMLSQANSPKKPEGWVTLS
jgi:acetolactate synthase-1/2/3 large subunit